MDVLDLFSGIGGFSLGLERSGMKTVAFCEVDEKCRKVLHKHWPFIKRYTDVKELTIEQLKKDKIKPEVICGGFPCQDISVAGNREGIKGRRSSLWSEFKRLIKDVRPSWAIIENVSALRSKGLVTVLQDIYEIGYDAEWHCVPASSIGAPHQRDRIWIVAYPNHNGPLATQEPGTTESRVVCSSKEQESTRKLEGSSDGKCRSSSLANANNSGSGASQCKTHKFGSGANQGREGRPLVGSSRCCKDVANASVEGLQRSQLDTTHQSRLGEGISRSLGSIAKRRSDVGTTFWEVEPPVGRVVDGLSGRVDRLKQLGNSVVPQIPEAIGVAIMEYENHGNI